MLSPRPQNSEPYSVITAQACAALYQLDPDDELFEAVYQYWLDSLHRPYTTNITRAQTIEEYLLLEDPPLPLQRPGPRSYASLKEQADITDFAARFTELRQIGGKFRGRCPIHDDRTPSFWVYPETRSYYCFGCTSGGDVIDLARALNRDPYEALAQP